jgi:hypothetical protein
MLSNQNTSGVPMTTKTLYLHVGLPKTGTSAIQTFCSLNREALKKYNLYYPVSGILEYGQYELFTPWHNPNALNKKKWQDLLAELEQYRTDNLLISSEALGAVVRLTLHERNLFFDGIARQLPAYKIKIIIYLRKSDDFLKSLYKQQLKEKSLDIPFDSIEKNFNYSEYVSQDRNFGMTQSLFIDLPQCLIEKLGRENVICRIYDRSLLKNGNIIDDFFSIFNIELEGLNRDLGDVNPPLPTGALPVLATLFSLPNDLKKIKGLGRQVAEIYSQPMNSQAGRDIDRRAVEALIDQTEALCPGYKNLFTERPFDLSFPEADLDPKTRLIFYLLFSLYAQNAILQSTLQQRFDFLSARNTDSQNTLQQRLDILYAQNVELQNTLQQRLDFLSARNTDLQNALQQRLDSLSAQNTDLQNTLQRRSLLKHEFKVILRWILRHLPLRLQEPLRRSWRKILPPR